MLRKILPVAIFILSSLLIIGALLFYSPSWGLVDDFQLLRNAKFVWSGGSFFRNLGQIFLVDLDWGMFRPVYYTWAMLVYYIFKDTPLLIYLGIAAFNLITLLLWGFVLNKIWLNEEKNIYCNIFLYPLTFFVFTPFWNNFMYISMQQKFIIFFSALAIHFFYKGYVKERKIFFVFSVFAILLGILSHGEGIFLNLAMLLLTIILYFLTKKKSLIFSFVLNLFLFIPYVIFTFFVQIKGTYSSKYGNNLNFNSLLANFLTAPALIRIVTLLAIFCFCFLVIILIKRKNKFSPVFLIMPLAFICFIAVLTPWGFPNYHPSVLTPFIMGMLFPFYSSLNSRSPFLRILTNSFLLSVLFFVLFFICFPRISKMSDIKKTEQFIIGFEKERSAGTYFMAPPCMEACDHLGYITKTKIIYLYDSLLSGDELIEPANNFMIFRDECPSVNFEGVQELKEVYRNNTWKIFSVIKRQGIRKEFKVIFTENWLEKIKTFLRR